MVLAVVVLTYNEELNLSACLASLEGLPHTLMVVDSGSTDSTLSIAAAHGARTLAHPFISHATQWSWALEHLEPNVDWVLGLDADQCLSTELKAELLHLFASNDERLCRNSGFYLNRRQIFRGTWIRHGGYYPKYLLKLFRVSNVRIDERDLMDHHFYVSGAVDKLPGDLIEDNLNERNISFWISKHVRYAELHAREELARRSSGTTWLVSPAFFGTPDERIVWLKRFWYRMPLYIRPFLYFVYRYVFRRGFLDGKQGFIFHFLQSFWYRLLVDIRLDDMRAQAK